MTPKISVIINTFNRAHYLKQSISSVLTQSYNDFELIVWDDGSTDSTSNVVSNFNDERIVYIKNKHIGQYQSRNKALDIARGIYISFLDSDDYFLSNKLEFQYRAIFNNDFDCCLSNYYLLDEYTNIKKKGYFIKKKSGEILNEISKNYQHNCLSTLFFKKKIIQKYKIKFIEKYKIISDKDFILNLAKFGKIKRLTTPLTVYRLHNNNVSIKNKSLEIKELEDWIYNIKNKKLIRFFSNKQINNLYDRVHYLKTTHKNNLKDIFIFYNNFKKIKSFNLKIKSILVALNLLIIKRIFK
jgi:glycosyltransferase involved in cell wall biosynthesis